MTLLASSVSVAISVARAAGTLRVEQCFNQRLQTPYWAICDDVGVICVALTQEEADQTVGEKVAA